MKIVFDLAAVLFALGVLVFGIKIYALVSYGFWASIPMWYVYERFFDPVGNVGVILEAIMGLQIEVVLLVSAAAIEAGGLGLSDYLRRRQEAYQRRVFSRFTGDELL